MTKEKPRIKVKDLSPDVKVSQDEMMRVKGGATAQVLPGVRMAKCPGVAIPVQEIFVRRW